MPMAGRGSRFQGSLYTMPKPLIEVNGIPMFIHSLKSLEGVEFDKIIFIALASHEEDFRFTESIKKYVNANVEIILLPEVTQGQLCTVLTAKEFINNDEDFLIISSDTIVKSNIGEDIRNKRSDCKGIISVALMDGDRWSFAKTDESGKVIQVAEKVRISDHASTGLYYFSNGKQFVTEAEKMVERQQTTKGEYYVIPLYQEYINAGEFIGISSAYEMWDMGTPDALASYLQAIN